MDPEPLGLVCQTCGDEGFTNAYVYCVRCLKFVIHRYCLDVIPRTLDEFVYWFCENCKTSALAIKYATSRLHKDDPLIKIAHVKKLKLKKKQKKEQLRKRKIVPEEEEEATGPDRDCVLGPKKFKCCVVLGLAKGIFHEQSPESVRLDNCLLRKHVSLQSQNENLTNPEQVTKPNGEDANQIIPYVDREVSQKQSSRLHKDDPMIKIAHVKKLKLKKKQKKEQLRKRKIVPEEEEEEEVATGPDRDCVLGPKKFKCCVVLGLAKGISHKQSPESIQLDNCLLRKHESLQSQNENVKNPEQVTKPNGEDADQIIPCVDRGVSQKQSSESKNQASAIPENEPLQSQKKDAATNSAQVETIMHKKKQKKKPKKKQIKKKKTLSLVVRKDEEVTKPNHECISPTKSPHKVNSDSGPNQITPCVLEHVVFQKQHSSESAELGNCYPVDGSVKRTSDASSVDVRQKKRKNRNSIVEHSSCESSCTDVPLKRSVDEQKGDQRCELNQAYIVDLVSDSSSIEKDSNNKTTEIETENRMHQEQGAYASQLAYVENNVQSNHYLHARPIIDPLWRGSFHIVQTDYKVFEGFVGHLSSKACARVRDEACTFPPVLSLEMQPKTDLWPKSFLESMPSDENIALYFLPGSTKNKRDFEQLVTDMIVEEVAMKATTKNAELLIFTSKVLPEPYWMFQGSYYLWGVFRRKKNDDHGLAASNNSGNRGPCSYQITSEKEILTRVMM